MKLYYESLADFRAAVAADHLGLSEQDAPPAIPDSDDPVEAVPGPQ